MAPSSALHFVISGDFALVEPPDVSDVRLVHTNDDGAFEFPSVRAGDWTLYARATRGAVNVLKGTAAIRVSGLDIEDVRIQLSEPFAIKGQFQLSDGSPPSGKISGDVSLDAEAGPDMGVGAMPDGAFQINNMSPGRYRIRPNFLSLGNYYVSSVLLGDIDVGSQYVQLSPSSPTIRLILKPGSMIRGTVEKGEGATVVLWPENAKAGDSGLTMACGPGETFEFSGLAPGEYNVIAVDRFSVPESLTAARLQAMESRATRLHVEEGSTASVQIELTGGVY